MKKKEDDHMEILQVTHLNKSYGTGEGKVTALICPLSFPADSSSVSRSAAR